MKVLVALVRGEELIARVPVHRTAHDDAIADAPGRVGVAFPAGERLAVEERDGRGSERKCAEGEEDKGEQFHRRKPSGQFGYRRHVTSRREPLQASRQMNVRELNMDNPAPRRRSGGRRRVEQQWFHHEHITGAARAGHLRRGLSQAGDLFVVQYTMPMRARQDAERAVVQPTVVEMDAQRDHPFENMRWRMHVWDAALHRPAYVTRCFDARRNRDGRVLMPRDDPVRAR